MSMANRNFCCGRSSSRIQRFDGSANDRFGSIQCERGEKRAERNRNFY